MSTERSSPAQPARDPDVAGAEAALHRAARRAKERAEGTAGIGARDEPADKAGGRRGTQIDRDPRRLTFSQAQGYEEIPGPLQLGELPKESRTRIWNLFFRYINEGSIKGPSGHASIDRFTWSL